MVKAHFTELLTNYGDVDIVWIDQSGTDKGGMTPGAWPRIKAHIHALQPDCLVIANNAASLDISDILGYEYPYSLELPAEVNPIATEVCDKLNQGWFANPESPCVPVRQRISYDTLKKSVMSPVRSTLPSCMRSLWHSMQFRSNTPWTTSW